MAPCAPALNFVANGPAGSLPITPLDPNDVPTIPNSPTFSQTACGLLGDLCTAMDTISAVDDLAALADSIDALALASDSQLTLILEELDSVVGTSDAEQAYSDFAGAQPGATSLLGGVSGIPLPAVGAVPMTLPNGQATITFGGPPEQGGPAVAGSAAYTLHLPVLRAGPGVRGVSAQALAGPNPPFVGVETGTGPMSVETLADGTRWWVARVLINPASAGQFTATLYYAADATLAGLSGVFQRALPFEVVVEHG